MPQAIQQGLEGADRVATIVRAMKEFSHPGSPEKRLVDLNRSLQSTVEVSRNEWKYVADVVTDFDPELPSVPCLQGEMNQVFLNLIINAADAIHARVGREPESKGTITVRTRACGEHVEVSIRDTGTGIPEAIRQKIFEPFFTTKDVGKGTGQGLALAHAVVVDRHGGSIGLETTEGEGTTFIIRLPLVGPGLRKEDPVLASILFVDDDVNVLMALRRMLHPMRHEWQMSFATGAQEALAKLAQAPFDVVVSDVRMPVMTGIELLAEVRRRYPHTARIILSGQSNREATARASGCAHQYLSKPCDPEVLKKAIGHGLRPATPALQPIHAARRVTARVHPQPAAGVPGGHPATGWGGGLPAARGAGHRPGPPG